MDPLSLRHQSPFTLLRIPYPSQKWDHIRTSLDNLRVDFGFVDPRYAGLEHTRSFFSTLAPTGDKITDPVRLTSIVCCDQHSSIKVKYKYSADYPCGEFTFVPLSEDAPKEKGHLMCFVYHHLHDKSSLDFFDVEAIEDGPIAHVHIQNRVPFGFHGTFVPNAHISM